MVANREIQDVKTFRQQILEAENHIAQATSELFRLEEVLDEVCRAIQVSLGFEFVGISLVNPEQNTIEAVHGTGIAADWSGCVKHYLEDDPDLRDIQADVVRTLHTEIVSGWDKRFDRWIYEEYHHDKLIRIFTPIILIQDDRGRVIADWFERCQWEVGAGVKNEAGQYVTCKIELPEALDPDQGKVGIMVIGTVETGYRTSQRPIDPEQARDLVQFISQRAPDIWQAQLPYVFKTIAESAMAILQADSATLHFLYDPNLERYVYEVFTGRIRRHFLKACPPRRDGLGRRAIHAGKCKYIDDPQEMARFNPQVSAARVKAMAAFPLQVGKDTTIDEERLKSSQGHLKEGVLYVEFYDEHRFTEDELRWGELFANRAVDAIRHATTYEQMRDRSRKLNALHSIAGSLSHLWERDNLLRHIAWSTLNVLAADVVTIYEYIQTDRQFLTPPDIAGRLKDAQKMEAGISGHNVPYLLFNRGENVYVTKTLEETIFKDSLFALREGIKSTAGILLKAGQETVGVMFINYRRPHYFSGEEKQIVETLAASAAIAIKNQRWLDTVGTIDREIITTLDQDEILQSILQRAVQIATADLGEICLLDPIGQDLIVKARHPDSAKINRIWERIGIDEGICGRVARNRQSSLVNDVHRDPDYKSYLENGRSELCVPLLDKDGRVLGVLNVESCRAKAFTKRHQRMLEALANQAVLAIQNAENKEQLVGIEKIATLGDLAGPLIHKTNSYLGAIQVWTQRILMKGDESSKPAAVEIQTLASSVLEQAERLQGWLNEQPQAVDLHQVLQDALKQVYLPARIVQTHNISTALPQVWGGKQQLTYVFSNLIQNAKEAMPNGGKLSVDCETLDRGEEGWVLVKVSDTGIGIAEENIPKIFQADYTTKSGHGGFGLWWSQTYIKRLKGTLKVESKVNNSSIFTVVFPIWQGNASQ